MPSEENSPRVDALLGRLDAAWSLSRWHSIQGAVKGLTDEEAAWIPPDYQCPETWGLSGCVLDILYHVAEDSLVYPNQALGDGTLTSAVVEARFRERGGNREAALDLLDEGYQTVRDWLDKLSDADLDTHLTTPQLYAGLSVEALFVELIEHYVYHAGQVHYVRSLYEGAWAAEGAE